MPREELETAAVTDNLHSAHVEWRAAFDGLIASERRYREAQLARLPPDVVRATKRARDAAQTRYYSIVDRLDEQLSSENVR